jgi:uncharacterized protein HemX
MCDECCGRKGKFLTGMLAGIAAALGGYYFLNKTEKGKEVKKELKKMAEEVEERGGELRKKALKLEGEVEERVERGVEQMKERLSEELTHLDELRDRGRRAVKFFTSGGKKMA